MGCASSSVVKGTDPQFSKDANYLGGNGGSGVGKNGLKPQTPASALSKKHTESSEKSASINTTNADYGDKPKSAQKKEMIVDIAVTEASNNTQQARKDVPPGVARRGSVIRNGVYYSESEMSEEGCVWQPKYWGPDRIGSWIEDIEYPDAMRFEDVCKLISYTNELRPSSRSTQNSNTS